MSTTTTTAHSAPAHSTIAAARSRAAEVGDRDWSVWRRAVVREPPALHLDGTVAYVAGWALLVPATGGVYLVHDLRGFLYIGRTRNLNTRYRQHYWATHNRNLVAALRHPVGQTQFSWISCDAETALVLERDLVRGFQPLCNQIRFTS